MTERCHHQWPNRSGRLDFAARLAELVNSLDTEDPEATAAFERVIRSVRSDVRPAIEDVSMVLMLVVDSIDVFEDSPADDPALPRESEPKIAPSSGRKKRPVPPPSAPAARPRSAFADRIREEDDLADSRTSSLRTRLRLGPRAIYVDAAGRRRLKEE